VSEIYRGRLLDMPRPGQHHCRPAALSISADTFAAVDVEHDGPADLLLMPPFANAHDHVRGVRPISLGSFDLPLELWLTAMTNTPKVDPYLVAAAALGRQALGGVGAVMIHYTRPQDHSRVGQELETIARAAAAIGVRVAIAVAMRDRNRSAMEPTRRSSICWSRSIVRPFARNSYPWPHLPQNRCVLSTISRTG
jgi:cytosine/adenosine deaminase-related metal-dependent hydrolase